MKTNFKAAIWIVFAGVILLSVRGYGQDAPVITLQPSSQTGYNGTAKEFTSAVFGTPPLTNTWFYNGSQIPLGGKYSASESGDGAGNVTNTLEFLGTTNDEGSYFMVSSNAFGSVTSQAAMLTVGRPPTFVQQPPNQTAATGSTTIVSVTVAGTEPITYQWFHNQTPMTNDAHISGAQASALTISNTVAADAGSYMVALNNDYGYADSADGILTVVLPPAITSQPLDRSTPLGSRTIFSATVTGTQPAFQWQFNGVDIPGQTNTVYTNFMVSAGDFGTYHLIASNISGTVTSSDAVLGLGVVAAWGGNTANDCLPPLDLTNGGALSASSKSSFILQPDGSVLRWGTNQYYNLAPLTNAVGICSTLAIPDYGVLLRNDGTVATWGFTSPPPQNSNIVAVSYGNYPIYLRRDGTIYATNYPPATVLPPGLTKVVAISAGLTQDMALRSDGTVVVWSIGSSAAATNMPAGLSNVVAIASGNGVCLALKADGRLVQWTGKLSLAPTNVPALLTNASAPGVSAIAAGGASPAGVNYGSHCLALLTNGTVVAWGSNQSGQTNVPPGLSNVVSISAGAMHNLALVSDGRPIFLQQPVGGDFASLRDAVLNAQVSGKPPLAYQWRWNGTDVAGATNSTLTIPKISFTNAGTYQLVVTNALGSATSLATPVRVYESRPYVSIQPYSRTNVVGTSTAFGIPINGSGPMSIQWQFANTTNKSNEQPAWQNIPGATNEDFTLAQVSVGDAGTYSVVASNIFGTFTSSNAVLTVQQVIVWGDGSNGKTNLPAGLTNVIAVTAGNVYTCMALLSDGTPVQWGYPGPTRPSNITNLTEVAVSYSYFATQTMFGLRSDGKPAVWGSFQSRMTNVLAGLSNIVSIEADDGGSTFLHPDGTITRMDISGNVIALSSITNVVAITRDSGDTGFTALRADGTFYTSGPAPFPAMTNVVSIASSFYEGVALKRDGTIQSWMTFTNRPTSNIVAVAATRNGSKFAVRSDGSITNWGSPNSPSPTNIPPAVVKPWVLDGGYEMCVAFFTTNDFPPLFLSTALDTSNLVVSSASSPHWYGQTRVSHDGKHAARSADLGSSTASSMRMLTNGPVQVSFWWKVSSETNHDFLTFSIGGVPQAAISGEVDWQQVTFMVPPGPQMLVWTYSKDATGTAGMDSAFVDQLTFAPVPPTITAQPVDQTIIGPNAAFLRVSAVGTAPLTYRWYKVGRGLQLTGPASIYQINPTYRSSSGTYYVVVTNSVGTVTSSNTVLTVHVPQTMAYPLLQADGTFVLTSEDSDATPFDSSTDISGFQAQYSSNLIDWLPVTSPLSVSNGVMQLNDTDSTNAPQRFYRIIENW